MTEVVDSWRERRNRYFRRDSQSRRMGYGYDPAGRPYISETVPWARHDPTTGEVTVDVALARQYGLEVFYDENTKALVLKEVGV